jgi:SpoVK/Ycf46/Vps4 family AAA+-type ATPase
MSKFVGESEAAIRDIFRKALSQAENLESKCAVIFWDEVDALGRARRSSQEESGGDDCSRRILAELLMELNKLSENTVQRDNSCDQEDTSLTNDHHQSDSQEENGKQQTNESNKDGETLRNPRLLIVAATNRPEDCDPALLRRFGIRCFVGPPSHKHRRKILQGALEDVSHSLQASDFYLLANLTDKWSGCDLQNMAREAAMAPVRECIRAAVLRRKQATQQETNGTTVPQISCRPDQEAHQMMMEGIQNLRPITLQDFAFAIDFVLMKQDDARAREMHYDSSSDEEENDVEDEEEEVA